MRIADRWQDGAPYERYVGRWSRPVAKRFVTDLDAARGIRWLDVGCGTGALTEAIVEYGRATSVTGVDPSADFLAVAASRAALVGREDVRFVEGRAERLPVPDGSAGAVVSGLVLNFLEDPAAALAEFRRVATPRGLVAAYVWDYAEGMELIRRFWDAAVEADPAAATLHEARRFPLCRPDALRDLWAEAIGGDAAAVRVWPIDVPTVFADFDDFWTPFLGGQGPAPSYLAAVPDAVRERIRTRLEDSLPFEADGTIALTARAWAVAGRTPE